MFRKLLVLLFLGGCVGITPPPEFVYQEIKTDTFTLASWQKISNPDLPYKIYIEGDGYAYNSHGRPSQDPTPKGTLVRELAYGDNNANVVYLARPCQYIISPICSKRHWTTARFAPEVINAEYSAIKQIAGSKPIVLVGFSGGAQVAGLVASAKPNLNVQKIITIAGNLDHVSWTDYFDLSPLDESMSLTDYKQKFISIPQVHYVGQKDKVIPPHLVKNFVDSANVVEVDGASHNQGWEPVFSNIRNE